MGELARRPIGTSRRTSPKRKFGLLKEYEHAREQRYSARWERNDTIGSGIDVWLAQRAEMIFCVSSRRPSECPNRVDRSRFPAGSARCNRAKFAEVDGNTAHPEARANSAADMEARNRLPNRVTGTAVCDGGLSMRSAIALFASSRRMIQPAANGLSPSASVLIPQRARQIDATQSVLLAVRPW